MNPPRAVSLLFALLALSTVALGAPAVHQGRLGARCSPVSPCAKGYKCNAPVLSSGLCVKKSSGGLSTGAKVGIGLGVGVAVLATLLLCCLCAWCGWCCFRACRKKAGTSVSSTSSSDEENARRVNGSTRVRNPDVQSPDMQTSSVYAPNVHAPNARGSGVPYADASDVPRPHVSTATKFKAARKAHDASEAVKNIAR